MNKNEYRFLLTQQATLNNLISQTDESEVIVRMSLTARLQKITKRLNAYEGFSPNSVNASLTFSGKPVDGRRGIEADFGAKALSAFEKAVASVGASQDGYLREMGPIPNRDAYGLMITGIAHGSFGFEFEEASPGDANFQRQSRAASAVETVMKVLQSSVETEDNHEFADTVSNLGRRAIKDVCDFLEIVVKNEAVCALEFGDDEIRFQDTQQVRRSAERLGRIRSEEVLALVRRSIDIEAE